MKKKLVFLLLVGFSVASFAQKEEKVKGNKEVVEKRIPINKSYHTLDVDGDFEIILRKQGSLSANIETDSNILPYVDIAVIDSVLTITSSKIISRVKELKVTLGYTDELATILVKDKVTITGDQAIKGDKLLIDAKDNAEVNVDSKSVATEILLKDKAKFEGLILSKDVTTNQSGSSKIKATISSAEIVNSALNEKSVAVFVGETEKSIFLLDGDGYLNAIKMDSAITSLSGTVDSDAYVKCTDKIVLQLSGKSKTYIMGNPLVQLTRFEDEASLYKTKKEPSSLGRLLK